MIKYERERERERDHTDIADGDDATEFLERKLKTEMLQERLLEEK